MTDEQRALKLLRFLSDGSVRTVDEACLSVDQLCPPMGWMLLPCGSDRHSKQQAANAAD
ncbi:MAG: hypothetical protein WAK31_03995 [Chthoniobacterales bacterium]